MNSSTPLRRPFHRSPLFYLLVAQVLLAAGTGLVNPRFLTLANLTNILEQIAVLGMVAAGLTLLLVAGEIDISVGANIGLSACLMALLIGLDLPPWLAVSAGIALAMGNGFLVGWTARLLRAPSFITSLAFISIFRGTAMAMTKGTFQTIYGRFETIGETRLGSVLPLSFLICLVVAGAVHLLLWGTRYGRRVYAVGSNPTAAYLSGISVNRTKLIAFLLSGLCVGLAAMTLLSRIGAAQPSTGSGLELRAIGAVVIGGTPLTGGRGGVAGTLLGVLLMGLIANAMNMLGVNPYYQEVTFGALIIAALAVGRSGLRRNAGTTVRTET